MSPLTTRTTSIRGNYCPSNCSTVVLCSYCLINLFNLSFNSITNWDFILVINQVHSFKRHYTQFTTSVLATRFLCWNKASFCDFEIQWIVIVHFFDYIDQFVPSKNRFAFTHACRQHIKRGLNQDKQLVQMTQDFRKALRRFFLSTWTLKVK